ncbi:MAG: large extracellular alpha-helical protein, partial [Desulfobacterales bacterium]|nr:large extracellular alpha-helical protein [Desulfobacterales bacterium]
MLWLCLPAAALGAETPLKILRITPEGQDVPAGRQIVVEFDRPVVPLGRMERTAEELPITVTPELKCQWRWLNPSALACQLGDEESLAPATTYRLSVAPGIRTQGGATLAGTVRHSFTTLRPGVENAWFQTWRSPGTPVMLVTFNQPVALGTVTRHLYLQQLKGERRRFGLTVEPHPDDQEPPIAMGADQARTRWQVSPLNELPLETAVSLRVEPGLISARGPEVGVEERDVVRF